MQKQQRFRNTEARGPLPVLLALALLGVAGAGSALSAFPRSQAGQTPKEPASPTPKDSVPAVLKNATPPLTDPSVIDAPWDNPPAETISGVEHHIFYSDGLRRSVGYNIYLPPGYLADTKRRFPVIYYLHGMTDTESSHLVNVNVLDAAIKNGTVPPLIYVYVYGGRTSWFTDTPDGGIRSETLIVKDLLQEVDRSYRTIANRNGRGLQGFSMGGYGALKLAFKYPDLFNSVVAYSGALLHEETMRTSLPEVYRRVYGGDPAYFAANSPFILAEKNAKAIRDGVAIRIVCGDADRLISVNREMNALLTRLNIPHEYEELPGVGHDPRRVYSDIGVKGFVFQAAHLKSAAEPTK